MGNIHTAHQEESLNVGQVVIVIFGFPESLCLMEKILPAREYVLGGGKNFRAIRIGLVELANGFAGSIFARFIRWPLTAGY